MKFLLLLHIVFLSMVSLNAKVLVMTHSYNRPDFISLQYHAFKKFIEDEFEFVVFNDAPNDELFAQIEDACKQLDISTVRVPQILHTLPYFFRGPGVGGASAECAETIQYMLNSVGFRHPGIVMVVDSDMFLIRHLHIEKFLQGNDIAAYPWVLKHPSITENSISYFLPNLLFFNMEQLQDKAMLNFNLGEVNGIRTDTGGFNYYYIERHPDLKWFKFDMIRLPFDESKMLSNSKILSELENHPATCKLLQTSTHEYEFYADYRFLHFKEGSNWNHIPDTEMAEKTSLFFDAISELLNLE